MRRVLAPVGLAVLLTSMTLPALAAKPSSETFIVDDHVVDTRMCADFDVMVDATGHVRVSEYVDAEGNVVMEIANIAIHVSYSANGNTVQLIDAGIDRFTFNDDGSFTLAITGIVQLVTAPGEGVIGGETGRLLLAFSPTGEVTVISEHGKRAGDRTAAICELLAA